MNTRESGHIVGAAVVPLKNSSCACDTAAALYRAVRSCRAFWPSGPRIAVMGERRDRKCSDPMRSAPAICDELQLGSAALPGTSGALVDPA